MISAAGRGSRWWQVSLPNIPHMDTAPHLMLRLADTTAQRDRDQIETSLARLLLEYLRADVVSLLKLENQQGRLLATNCVSIRRIANRQVECARGEGAVVPIDSLPGGAACLASGEPQVITGAQGGFDALFAIGRDAGQPAGIMHVRGAQVPEARDLMLVDGILRIVRNHMELLDYGERDTLTGLLNRKTFEGEFERLRNTLAQQAGQSQAADWIALVDVDRFKSINDGYGHVFGDEVLLLVSQIMQRSFRGADRVYRFGGEEFVILLRDLTAERADGVMERLRAAVEAHRFPQVGLVTISVGWTRILARDTASSAIGRADAALYFAKENGRNQAHCHEHLLRDGRLAGQRQLAEIELF